MTQGNHEYRTSVLSGIDPLRYVALKLGLIDSGRYTDNTYILDIDRTKISPEYVKCYLSSKAGQQELMKYASGSTTPITSVSNLGNIEIPMYDEATQKELNQHSKEIVSSLNESYKQIKICEEEMDSLFG